MLPTKPPLQWPRHLQLSSSAPVEQKEGEEEEDLDERFFRAFNLKPDPFAGHEPLSDLHGPLPHFEDGVMFWTPSKGQSGWVPFNRKTGARAKTEEYYGLKIEDMMANKMGGIYAQEVRSFKIAYTVAYPAQLRGDTAALDRLPLIGLLHGVPTNHRWKIEVMKELGKFAVVVAWSMLGMGESDQVMDLHFPGDTRDTPDVLRAWDWKHDTEYVHQLMTEEIPRLLGLTKGKRWFFSADDWGGGIALRYLAKYGNRFLIRIFFVDPIWLDGHFVIEIGSIGLLNDVRRRNPGQFEEEAAGLPQKMIGILKYMVQDRWKMNRYTEVMAMAPYMDVHYQEGKDAAGMFPNFWNIAVLAARSSRLAPRQLQPYALHSNPHGVRMHHITTPITMIWGVFDQMMPPSQVFRSAYLFPKARYNYYELQANHFSEIDDPHAVVRAMLNELLREPAWRLIIPLFLGNGAYVMKGDERELIKHLGALQVPGSRTNK